MALALNKSLGVPEVMVPFMAVVYVGGALVILLAHLSEIRAAFGLIFSDAFSVKAVAGGVLGTVIRAGISRGIFSNESSMGTAPIAQAAAKPADPVLQNTVAMLGTFIDTIVVCSMTALVLVISGLYGNGESGVALTMGASTRGGRVQPGWSRLARCSSPASPSWAGPTTASVAWSFWWAQG